jgi:regulator of protease activity HflC (stomatin/prohibitin superfamily)
MSILKVLVSVGSFLVGLRVAAFGFGLLSEPDDASVAAGVAVLLAVLGVGLYVGKALAKKYGERVLAYLRGVPASKILLLSLALPLLSGCVRVGPGYVGIKVNMSGTQRGVESFPKVTGWVFYLPGASRVLEYPTFVQTAIWTKNPHEGHEANEEISFNSKEGMVITGDISLSYQIDAEKVPSFYVKFRSDDLNVFTHGFLRNIARDAFNEVGPYYPVEEIYGPKKEEVLKLVRERINKQVQPFGVEIQQFGFTEAPRLPAPVVEALNAKIQATQNAIRVENEVRQAEAEAKKTVAIAQGDAKATVAKADGEAKANQLLAQSLSENLLRWRALGIQQQALEKWNGQLPQYTGGAVPLIQLPAPAK